MKYVVLAFFVSAVFAAGYFCGKAGEVKPVPQAAVTKPSVSPVEKSAANTEAIARHEKFQEFIRDSLNRANDLQAKINNMSNMSLYLQKQTEDAAKAGSLEGSMVLEARYRESLNALWGLKDELNALLATALHTCIGYISLSSPAK
jgi:hypothetical protein